MKDVLGAVGRECGALLRFLRDNPFGPQPVLVPIKTAGRKKPGAKDAS